MRRCVHKGFTLIELMITVVIMAILLAVAAPSFNTMIVNNRSIALGEDMASALNFTRSEAVKRGRAVSICASNDGENCNGGWTDGYIVFVDETSNITSATMENDDIGTVLRVWDNTADGASISAKRNGADITFVRFTGMGTLARINDFGIQFDAEITHCEGSAGRTVTIGISGSVGMAKKDCT